MRAAGHPCLALGQRKNQRGEEKHEKTSSLPHIIFNSNDFTK